jgi:Transposase DDE domain
MSRFIRKVITKSGATAVQIATKRGRELVAIEHVGSAHTDTELEILLIKAKEKLNPGQLSLPLFDEEGLGLYLEYSYSKTLWECLERMYLRLGFDALGDEVFKQLVLARIIEPTSKLDTIRVLEELGLKAPSNTGIHRCLKRIIEDDFRDTVSRCCVTHASPDEHTLLLYDVTTLYFEIQKEDEYRIAGLSKERRLEPQITVGLLVDSEGFPLEVSSFEGNKAETKTIVPVLEAFTARHGLSRVTVAADAAMLSAANLTELERLGYTYVVGSRIAKTPYAIEEFLKNPEAKLRDQQIFDSYISTTINNKRQKRRVVYQYRQKRASLDLKNIEKVVAKAQKMVEGKAQAKRNRFLKVTGGTKKINTSLVEEAKRKAGIKGYVTNLNIPAQQVIDIYHRLFQVEKSFRMSKSDLKARPIFHQTKDSIEAHLTVVFTALAISRYIEAKTDLSIKKFIRALRPVRTGIISLNNVKHELKPRIPDSVKTILNLLL